MLREVRFLCDEKNAEDFGDMLMDAGAMSVTVEDADRDQPDEQPLYGEPGLEPTTLAWKRSRLSVLVAENFDVITAAAIAAKALGIETPQIESDSTVPDENWVKLTQAQFGPTRVSDRLWIVPTWHEPPAPEAINIRLDPGVAFGTGSQATTFAVRSSTFIKSSMPIMAPFSDVIGISRQATVLAFQFGDGFTNMITPTSGVLMGALGLARIPYEVWVRWFYRILIVFILLGMVLLVPTVLVPLDGF